MHLFVCNRYRIFAGKRHSACENFVHHNPERVNIATLVSRRTLRLFWRKISCGTHYCASLGEVLLNASTKRASDSEVGDFYLPNRADENIARFHIAMNHAILMC